jgi:hypothetical protein
MPRYVIERQFLVPIFEHIFIEAPNLETACREAADDTVQPWGDHSEMDFDNSRPVTIAEAIEIPEGLYPELRSREDEDRHVLSAILYDSGLDLLPIPRQLAEPDMVAETPVGFV